LPADLIALYMKNPKQVSKESTVPSIVSQPVVATLTRAAIFLVVTINSGRENDVAVRALCGDLAAFLRAVRYRDLEGRLSCVMAFGSDAWDRLFGRPKPKDLHPFREIRGPHHAVSTPGDILFHFRSKRMDLCFELATQRRRFHGGRGTRFHLFRRSRPDRLRRVDGVIQRARTIASYRVKVEIIRAVFGFAGITMILHNTGNHGDRLLDEHLAAVFAFRGDKISRLDTYLSDIAMAETFFGKPREASNA
jgi:hypothetical protein